jgi:hypothetical protein
MPEKWPGVLRRPHRLSGWRSVGTARVANKTTHPQTPSDLHFYLSTTALYLVSIRSAQSSKSSIAETALLSLR